MDGFNPMKIWSIPARFGDHGSENLLYFHWLVVEVSTPLKNVSSSVGVMTFPTEWKVIKFHGSSHHQPVI